MFQGAEHNANQPGSRVRYSDATGKIDLLLGTPVFWKIVRGIYAHLSDSLVLLDTIYGNVLCGSTSGVGKTVVVHAVTVEELNKHVEKLWQLDSLIRDGMMGMIRDRN